MNIVCFSDIRWDFLKHRHHHILENLPSDWKILFFQPATLSMNKFKNSKIPDNVTIITVPTLPYFDRIGLHKVNDLFTNFWLKKYVKKFKFQNSTLLFYDPRFSSIIGKLNEKLIWYEIVDDRKFFQGIKNWYSLYMKNLLQKSDIVTTSSKNLFNKLNNSPDKFFYVSNAVDFEHFNQTHDIIPPDIKQISSPILGYVGTIGDWFDFELLKKILASFPKISVVLLGYLYPSQEKKIKELKNFKNFYFLGTKHYSEIPLYIKQFSLCLIPFKVNELTKSVNPLKLYEYSASGKNTVSTMLPEIEHFSNIVHFAKNHDEFIKLISDVLESPHNAEILTNFAKKNTWDVVIKNILSILENHEKKL